MNSRISEILVSILIPAYNVENYIESCLYSILNQDHRNIEIVVIDDASHDRTHKVIRNVANFDGRLRVFANDRNLKISKTLNRALSIASGEYIVRMDADDISEKDRVSTLLSFIESNPSYDIVGSSMTAINHVGDELFRVSFSNNSKFLIKSLKYNSPLAHIWIAKSSAYKKLGGYRELSGVEDYDLLLRAVAHGLKITNIRDYYGYRVRINRSGNTSDTMGVQQIKLHSYAWSLYKERLRRGGDSFSLNKVDYILKEKKIISWLHKKSNFFLGLSVTSKKNKILSPLYLIASLISPYQIIYLKNRFFFRVLKRFFDD